MRMCACRGTAGFAHVSCLAEQAKILVAEAEENNLGAKVKTERFQRWDTCSLCEQHYHGVVRCALGWACWKSYVGRPDADGARRFAMSLLGNGLSAAFHHHDALGVKEADLAMRRRLGDPENNILAVQSNLAITYEELGRLEPALRLKRDAYSGYVRLLGNEAYQTLLAANNYANTLMDRQRFDEAKAVFRKEIPVAGRVYGDCNEITLRMKWNYARALYLNPGATLDNLREAVTTLEDLAPNARRVFGGTHPNSRGIEIFLVEARAALRGREETSESPSGSG